MKSIKYKFPNIYPVESKFNKYINRSETETIYSDGTICTSIVYKEGYTALSFNKDLTLDGDTCYMAKPGDTNIIKAGTLISVDDEGVKFFNKD